MRTRHSQQRPDNLRGGAVHVPWSRGAFSGVLLVLLGAWGALVPFIGPTFGFAFTPDTSWTWTEARGWYEVLPGVAVGVAGLLLLASRNRFTAVLSAWLAVAGGAWFVVGQPIAPILRLGSIGTPTASGNRMRVLESLAYFAGLGAVVLFFAATAFGRLSVRSVGDVKAARRREADAEVGGNANDGATDNPTTDGTATDTPPTDTQTTDGTGTDRDEHPADTTPTGTTPTDAASTGATSGATTSTGAHAMGTDSTATNEATAEHTQRV